MPPQDDILSFVSAVSGDTFTKVEENLGDGFVRLNTSEAERRQAKHDIRSVEDVVVELLRNSRDAHAQRIFVATHRDADERNLVILDDGVGLPETMRERIFEPRVTSKLDTMVMDSWGVHGRGMALYSIRSNTAVASVACSAPHKGTSLTVTTDVGALPERNDQSTWPAIEPDDEGVMRVARGPHNIVRRVSEFALEYPGVDVFLGSPAEIIATLVMLARFELDEADLLFADDRDRLAVWQRPGAAADAIELADVAEQLGMPISERTAHRVLSGQITPLLPVLQVLQGRKSVSDAERPVDIYKDRRGLKIHPTDLAAFQSELERAFDAIAQRYYLHLKSEPRVTVGRDDIRVRFEIDKED